MRARIGAQAGAGDRADRRLFDQSPPDRDVALPVDRGQRIPAGDHRLAAGARDPSAAAGDSIGHVLANTASPSSSRVRYTASATAWCARRTGANLAGDGGLPFFGFIFDPVGRRPERSVRPAWRVSRSAAIRRLANLLQLWRQPGRECAAEQADRHEDLDAAVSIAAGSDREPRPAHFAATAQSAPPPDVVAAVGPGDRRRAWAFGHSRTVSSTELSAFGVGLERSTPLWYYVLKEAEVMTDGLRLTGVGARLVGEVIIGLLELDDSSYLSQRMASDAPAART